MRFNFLITKLYIKFGNDVNKSFLETPNNKIEKEKIFQSSHISLVKKPWLKGVAERKLSKVGILEFYVPFAARNSPCGFIPI